MAARSLLLPRRKRLGPVVNADHLDDLAGLVREGKAVLVGPTENPKWLRFACPCQCGATLALNLMKSHSPHWTVTQHAGGRITVSPSVDATECGSHFWIRESRIDWV